MNKRILTILTALCLTGALAGCGTGNPGSVPASSQPAPETTVGTTAPPTTSPPTQPKGDFNIFTGEDSLAAGADTRPVAVMIGNNDKSRPQYGLDQADMYVEAETEGGITRIMAVFANAARVPAQLGPVRSARSPFALLAQSLDAVYCHAGGSTAGLATVKNLGIHHIDGLVYDGSTFWRDANLKRTKGLEYSMMTSGDKLGARMKSANIRRKGKLTSLFTFGEGAGSGAGKTVQVFFSGAQTISFQYDAGTGLYTKYNGAVGKGSPHKTAGGKALTASNVLVLYDTKYAENAYTIGFNLKSGGGLLVSGGTSRPVSWSRSSSKLSITEKAGSPAMMATGKTYICLVSKGNEGNTKVG